MNTRYLRNGLISLLAFLGVFATSCKTPRYVWSTEEEYYRLPIYRQHLRQFKKMKSEEHTASVFIGDSMTEGYDLRRHLKQDNLVNMGISGDFTSGVLRRLDYAYRLKPKRIFVMIGINDITKNVSQEKIKSNYSAILASLKEDADGAAVYILSTLPTSMQGSTPDYNVHVLQRIMDLNTHLRAECEKNALHFVDMYNAFTDESGKLKASLTYDGLHLSDEGYVVWTNQITSFFHE